MWHCSQHPEDKRKFNKAAAQLKKFLDEIGNETLKLHLQNLLYQLTNTRCGNNQVLRETSTGATST